MKSCTFFGHRLIDRDIKGELSATLERLITEGDVRRFYVGNSGGFDAAALSVLEALKAKYDIEINAVLAYMPKEPCPNGLLPDGIEAVPPRFALDYRNNYMLNKSDVVVCYVTADFGGAAKFVKLAFRRGKRVINLAL